MPQLLATARLAYRSPEIINDHQNVTWKKCLVFILSCFIMSCFIMSCFEKMGFLISTCRLNLQKEKGRGGAKPGFAQGRGSNYIFHHGQQFLGACIKAYFDWKSFIKTPFKKTRLKIVAP